MITSHTNGYAQEPYGQGRSHRERAVDCPGEESSLVKPPHSSIHMERIQHYQEELKKRREEEGRGRHDINPDASLRLRKLSQNPKVGIDNPTFEGKEKAVTDTCCPDPQAGELRVEGRGWGVVLGRGLKEVRRGIRMGNCKGPQKKNSKEKRTNKGAEPRGSVSQIRGQVPLGGAELFPWGEKS